MFVRVEYNYRATSATISPKKRQGCMVMVLVEFGSSRDVVLFLFFKVKQWLSHKK